jgi:methionyl-tRNA synthetase
MTKRYLITSALPYINGVKHLGNLVGSMLPADIYARYLRQRGEQVLFICGTDDHGAPAEMAAEQQKMSVEQFCEQMHLKQKQTYDGFHLSFDYFGRTSDVTHHAVTKEVYGGLKRNGWIQERIIEQFYSNKDKRFLADRFIVGQCPHCHDQKARGDQCDGCGQLLEPTDLIDPRSATDAADQLVLKQTKHLFLNLKGLEAKINGWVNQLKKSKLVDGICRKWLAEGLQPRCITRDLKWGVPVPDQQDKVFYVWFDAPNAYVSFTKSWAKAQGRPDAWRDWWYGDDVEYTQYMAKDNVPFHAFFWPAMLEGSGVSWRKVDHIKAYHWLFFEDGKFSTSQQRGIFMDQALERYPADYWRYYLMANAPESADSNFTWDHFATTINAGLANKLGNFVSRVLALVNRHFDGKVPEHSSNGMDQRLLEQLQSYTDQLDQAYRLNLSRDMAKIHADLWSLGNAYITEKQPWALVKHHKVDAGQCIANCLYVIQLYVVTLKPFLPEISKKIQALLPEFLDRPVSLACQWYPFKPGQSVAHSVNLIEKITIH